MSTLLFSISGVRGIIGNGLDPESIIKYTNAYADFIESGKIVIGRDGRITGEMVDHIVTGTLLSKGLDVIDIGICPTPTVQYNVKTLKTQGGIAISASHNPNEWNALKLLNSSGQFISPEEHEIMKKYLTNKSVYKGWNNIGRRTFFTNGIKTHIDAILNLPIIKIDEIRKKKFRVVADCVNGAGAYCIPDLLRIFGCEVIELNCDKTGIFPRIPEPLPENLTDTIRTVKESQADFAVVVDPDADRLVLITGKGEPFGEENTITHVVNFILSKTPGNIVINLSTTRAVEDVAKTFGCNVFRSAVGEANVVKKMKEVNAVIGGEGSGGVIYPGLHYGRDALLGIAITLQHLTEENRTLSDIKERLPKYFISKKKIELQNILPDTIIDKLKQKYSSEKVNSEDGLRIDFEDNWVHFRKSNTEPILRIITEAKSKVEAEELSQKYFNTIQNML